MNKRHMHMFMQVRSNRHAFCFVAPASQPLNKPVPPPPSAQPAAVQQVRPASGLAASSTQVSACMFFGVCVLDFLAMLSSCWARLVGRTFQPHPRAPHPHHHLSQSMCLFLLCLLVWVERNDAPLLCSPSRVDCVRGWSCSGTYITFWSHPFN